MRETTLLKRELSRGERGRGKRYSGELRRRVREWALGRRQDGVSWTDLSSELGLGQDTVRRWCVEPSARKGGRSLLPVKVVQQPAESGRVAVVSPNGFRIEGLTLAEAATLFRALG
jgi:hypothetical protein